MSTLKTLLVAAYAKELAPFCTMGRKFFVSQNEIGYLAAGIGPTATSFGLTHALKDHKPERLIAIGTAGSFDTQKFPIGSLVCVASAHMASGDRAAYLPGPTKRLQLKDPFQALSPARLSKKIPRVNAFCPQEITKSTEKSQVLLQKGYDVEHLEAYSWLYVAKKFRVPLTVVLGITNGVGPKGHVEWQHNEAGVCETIRDFLTCS